MGTRPWCLTIKWSQIAGKPPKWPIFTIRRNNLLNFHSILSCDVLKCESISIKVENFSSHSGHALTIGTVFTKSSGRKVFLRMPPFNRITSSSPPASQPRPASAFSLAAALSLCFLIIFRFRLHRPFWAFALWCLFKSFFELWKNPQFLHSMGFIRDRGS